MKIFRIVLVAISLLTIYSYDADAQLLKKLFKKVGKETVESTAKKGAKEVTEDVVTKVLRKEFGQAVTKKTVSETSSEVVERVIKTTVSDGMNKALVICLKRNVDNIGLRVSGTFGKKTSKELVQNISSKEVRNVLNENIETGLKKTLQKRIVVESTEVLLKKQLTEVLGKRAAKEWFEKIAKEDVERKTRQLLADIVTNKKLRNAFKKNPTLLNSYNRALGSSMIRNDLSMLRYMDNGAGKFYNKGISSLNKYGDGSNLIYRDKANGITEILDSKTGRSLGTITKGDMGKYVIDVPEHGDRTLLNLYPQSNCTYKSGGCTWITDDKGRVIEARYKVNPVNNTNVVRSKNMDTQMGTWKNMYNTEGHLVGDAPSHMPDDDGGHLMALQHGGTSDAINYFPQDKLCNRKGIWRDAEKAAKQAADKGNTVECVIRLNYSNSTSLRPTSITRTQTVNGQYQKIKVGKKECVLDGKQMIDNPYNYSNTTREAVLAPLKNSESAMAA